MQKAGVPASWKPYLTELFGRESTWNPYAKNDSSTAYGYAQFLDTTQANYKQKFPQYDYRKPLDQLVLGIHYVKDRYGDPTKALAFWDLNNWY